LGKEVAGITGLCEGIPVALGSNDAAIAQVGAGNVNSGDALNISGSNEIITIITDKPILNNKYYIRKAVTPGKWQVFAIIAGGFAIEWFREEAFKDMDINTFYNEYLLDLVKKKKMETEVRFLPYLAGDRHSLEKKRGGFTGLTLGTNRDDMLIAILHGIHEPMITTMGLANEFLQINKTIKVTGGLSSNDYMLELKKSLFPGYDFKVSKDCPIIGNVKLALEYVEM
jgi:xylulokinase